MSHHKIDIYALLRILADGEFHSGESLGEILGSTRAAVWKRLQVLPEFGVTVESVKGRGYRLPGGLNLLAADKIRSRLSGEAASLLSQLQCFNEIGSTNRHLLEVVAEHGSVCLAERQTEGRGRRGRAWFSPFARNIYLSVRWHVEQGVASLEGLSLAVGVVLVEALAEIGVADLSLKWPNDLLLQGKKLGGILIEVGGDLTGECALVVGIGLNVNMPDSVDVETITQPWIDLRGAAFEVDRNVLCATLLNHLLPLLNTFPGTGFGPYVTRWMACGAYLGKDVSLSSPTRTVSGKLLGVDDRGALLLESESGVASFNGGEISLRAIQ